jgi:hypothetical protein
MQSTMYPIMRYFLNKMMIWIQKELLYNFETKLEKRKIQLRYRNTNSATDNELQTDSIKIYLEL